MDNRTVGILGGGQLGRMMSEAAHRLGVKIAVLDPGGQTSPAGQIAPFSIAGSFRDASKIRELAAISDIITTEIEHVDTYILEQLEKEGMKVRPNAQTIRMIQDKLLQKQHLSTFNIPLSDFIETPNLEAAREAGLRFGYPFMLKNRKLAYDGRGNAVVSSEEEISEAFNKLGNHSEMYAEKWVPFTKEIAAMVVRTTTEVFAYPIVETIQENNICHLVTAPAQISSIAMANARDISAKAISCFDGIGIYGVELFLLADDTVLVNEIAPRPHNSGHYTIEGCDIDQFEMHLRAILDLPCPIPRLRVGCAMMINLLGEENDDSSNLENLQLKMKKALTIPGSSIHWYGKIENRKGRKMAHLTITANNFLELKNRVEQYGLTEEKHGIIISGPRIGIIMGSDSDLSTMQDAAKIIEQFDISYEITIVSAHRTPSRLYTYAQSAVERGLQVVIAGAGGAAHLPGMIASLTSLPVIGVPIKTSILNGNDSLLSIVQMPKGIPVATVAIGNATNAGLLAIRILAAQDASLLKKMDLFLMDQENEVLQKATKLETIGYAQYLQDNK